MKISVLIDNSACQDHPELEAEHGLSFFIEQGNTRILCDMGVSSAFSDNAEKMGIDLQSADWAFVSHGHRDHSGGLETYLRSCRGEVWLSRHVFGHRFYSLRHTDKREISTAPQLEKEFSSRFRYLDGSQYICEGIAAVLPENVKPTKPDAELQAQDGMTSIAAMIFKFFPVALVLMAVTALIAAITSFLGMFNRRIFKGFGLAAIIMLVCAVVTLAAGLVALGNYNGNPQLVDEAVVSVLDFSKIGGFVMQGITGAPATAPTDVTMMNLVFTCGFGMLILLVVPVVILVLSFFARKKVPYSIFDR